MFVMKEDKDNLRKKKLPSSQDGRLLNRLWLFFYIYLSRQQVGNPGSQ